jgi:choline dehydrogenase-like flavoprotein
MDRGRLRTRVDDVVPADDLPSASEAGDGPDGLGFLDRVLADRPDWLPRVEDVVERGRDSPDWAWFAELVSAGYYADPANGGNTDAVSWRMVDWSPAPPNGWGASLPVRTADPVVVRPPDVRTRYDAIVIGSGAGGGVAAAGLAESGRSVLVVERGSWPSTADLARDHIRNPRSTWGLAPLSGPGTDEPRTTVALDGTPRRLDVGDLAWSNNAMTAGGGTRVYGAQAWRFGPRDFRMASTYGVPDGSSLADWPIDYEDLAPYYERAEWEMGVSGDLDDDGTWSGSRSRPRPMPPIEAGATRALLAAAADRLGWSTVHVPLLINSRPYLDRLPCARCGMCVGFACPVDAKAGSQNTMLVRAFATGRAGIVLETRATRLRTDASGRVVGVTLAGDDGAGGIWTRDVDAAEVVVAAGAVESARLLLASRSDREPNGIGNGADQVGRHLQGHLYGGATAVFDDVVDDLIGPGPSIATTDFRHGVDGLVGGGIVANEFVATPSNTYEYLVSAGLVPRDGIESKRAMRDAVRRTLRLMGPIQEVTTDAARVTLDPEVVDRFGIPVARLTGSVHPEDLRARDATSARAAEWLGAAGASRVVPVGGRVVGPSGGQHQAGTLRMGSDPATSVVDPTGRVWGHDNLRIADGSVHVTNGGVNPVLTIIATALRTIDLATR